MRIAELRNSQFDSPIAEFESLNHAIAESLDNHPIFIRPLAQSTRPTTGPMSSMVAVIATTHATLMMSPGTSMSNIR
jgi:hypothetical protein